MHISNAQIHKVLALHVHKCSKIGSTRAAAARLGSDVFSLSQKAALAQLAREKAACVPEVREEVVRDVASRLESGHYQIDPERLAWRLLRGVSGPTEV